MRLTPRAFGLLFSFAVSSCVGGPTSDWPKGADESDDGDPTTPPSNAGSADGGVSAPRIDAGKPVPADDACNETGEGDERFGDGGPSDALDPLDASTVVKPTSFLPDGGCR